jgi:hypothetical protein
MPQVVVQALEGPLSRILALVIHQRDWFLAIITQEFTIDQFVDQLWKGNMLCVVKLVMLFVLAFVAGVLLP